jgi:nicotinate-nucleotide adenylyltransferase
MPLMMMLGLGGLLAAQQNYSSSASHCDEKRKVAIYGGAFDPITNSHMTAVAEIIHSGHADEVWIVPSGPRPDKPGLKTPAIERYCMCQIAVNSQFSPGFPVKVSGQDIEKEEAAATYDMLCELRDKNPDCEFSFVIGSDWLQPNTDISKWDSMNPAWKPGCDASIPKKIVTGHKMLAEFDFLVIYRPGNDVVKSKEDPTGLRKFGPRLRWMEMPHEFTFVEGNLSSTEIRRRIKKSYEVYEQQFHGRVSSSAVLRPIDGLVPLGVMGFIYRTNLYRI